MASCPAAYTLASDVCDSCPAPMVYPNHCFQNIPLLLSPHSNSLINDTDWISLNEA